MLVPWRNILTKIGGEWGQWDTWVPQWGLNHEILNILLPPGQYGAGTESYFGLLRFLLGLNVLGALFQGVLTLLPLLLLGPIPGPPSSGGTKHCGPYNPVPKGLIDYPTYLTNLLSGEVRIPSP